MDGARIETERLRQVAVRWSAVNGTPLETPETEEGVRFEGRIPGLKGSLRRHAARGTIINSGFQVGLALLLLVQRMLVAIFLSPTELGIWGVVLVTLLTLLFIKNAGISEKFVQQSENDQEAAFQKAFTFELLVSVAFIGLVAVALPIFAILYGRWDIVAPAAVLSIAVLGQCMQAPTWIYYRRMDFVRQRVLQAVDPITTFVITVGLAIAGAGYWSLVIGVVIGAWTGGLVALRACPYKVGLRLDRATARSYFNFSWPLVIAGASGAVLAQGSVLAGSHTVGIAGVGAIALASSIVAFSDGVDAIVTGTLYPAICAVRERADLLNEVFVKSNRLALMWGMPFGIGLALFAGDLVHFVLGDKWVSAIFVLQAFGLMAAADQLGFNWTAFLRALDYTRPLAVVAGVQVAMFLAVTIPLMAVDGLHGFAIGMMITTAVTITARTYYLGKLFSGFQMLWHAARAVTPALPATAVILALRLVESGDRTATLSIVELALFVSITVATTALLERPLLRELIGYLRSEPVAT